MPEPSPEELPEGYYLENFEYLLDFVVDRYDHLLTADERSFYDRFVSLPVTAKKLFVRLTNRRGSYFRLDKLNYPEIENLELAVCLLVERTLVRIGTPPLEDAVGLCVKKELLSLAVSADLSASTRREVIVERFIACDCNPVQTLQLDVIEVLDQNILTVFKLLFFGNFHQDMTEFVLDKLVAPYEQYELTSVDTLFRNRHTVDEMLELKSVGDAAVDLIENDRQGDALLAMAAALPPRRQESLLARRYDRIVNRIARQLERLGRAEDALFIYTLAEASPSRERRARIHDRLGQHDAALVLSNEIARAPLDESEVAFAETFGPRMARKVNGRKVASNRRAVNQIPQVTIQVEKQPLSVEIVAADYFNRQEGDCYYVENTLLRGLFGLAFWDIIFAPVSGVFFNPFQRGPADLKTSDFVASRASQIECRLAMVRDGSIRQVILQQWVAKAGIANHFVAWNCLNDVLLEQALSRIPPLHLLRVFERMLRDLRHNMSGLPDLVLFPDTGYRLIEIKGPGDKLQNNQARWFDYFLEHQIPAMLVNVEYLPA